MPKISPTNYAVLGLLAARPWSAYELARHLKTRSNLRQMWPRAESKIYQAPKALVAEGWATSRKERAGGRPRTVYRITAKGRRALCDWLDEPAAPPRLELEIALKVAYATAGDLEQLRENLRRTRVQQRAAAELLIPSGEAMLNQGFVIPERAHTSALIVELGRRLGAAIGGWVAWAEEVSSEWQDIATDADKEIWARQIYEDAIRDAKELLEPSVGPDSLILS